MRVLITGGAGFIGSHLADRLLAGGHDVHVVDNFATARRDNLDPQPKLQLTEGSIADRELVDRAFEESGPDVVVHAAASYKDPENWYEDALTNVVGTWSSRSRSSTRCARRAAVTRSARLPPRAT